MIKTSRCPDFLQVFGLMEDLELFASQVQPDFQDPARWMGWTINSSPSKSFRLWRKVVAFWKAGYLRVS